MPFFNLTTLVRIAFCGALLIQAGCSDSGSSSTTSTSSDSPQEEISVDAVFVKGYVTDGSCELFAVNANGQKADSLATGTSEQGDVSFGSIIGYSGTALIECAGGTYTDEATGITLTAPMTRAVVAISGDAVFSVTPVTEIAVQRAEAEGNLQMAIDVYNQQVAETFGLDIDITEVIPIDVINQLVEDNPEGAYATALALISQLDASDEIPLEELVVNLADDLEDGSFSAVALAAFAAAEENLVSSRVFRNLNAAVLTNLSRNARFPVLNKSPVFTSASNINVAENQTATGYTATATDENNGTVSFSLTGGADQDLFSLSDGALSFNNAPDFEIPSDADASNSYIAEITANDGNGKTATLEVTITVTDVSQLAFSISYPTPDAQFGDLATQTTVRGVITDAEDSEVNTADISSLTVNNVPALFDAADPAKWSVEVEVPSGISQLATNLLSNTGPDAVGTQTISNHKDFSYIPAIAFDQANNRALVFEQLLHGIWSIDLSTGSRAIVSDASNGSGTMFTALVSGMEVDSANNRLLVIDRDLDALLAVDLSTGDRTVLSSASVGSGSAFSNPNDIAYDTTNNRALVTDTSVLLSVNLSTGDRTIVSNDAVGTGQTLGNDNNYVAYDEDNNRAFVHVFFDNMGWELLLLSVDLTTGNRTVVSGASQGTGPYTNVLVGSIAYNKLSNKVLLSNASGETSLLSIDLSTGDRTIVSDNTVGSGIEIIGSVFSLDSVGNRVLMVDGSGLLSIDLNSGDRSELSVDRVGFGRELPLTISHMILDDVNQRLITTGSSFTDTRLIDINSGDRTVVPDITRSVDGINGLVYDATKNQLLAFVESGRQRVLVSLALTTGETTELASTTVGAGPSFANSAMPGIAYDVANNRVLVFVRRGRGAGTYELLSVDLATGDRTELLTGLNANSSGIFNGDYDSVNKRLLYINNNALLWLDVVTGQETVVSDATVGSGAVFNATTDLVYDQANNRVLVLGLDSGSEVMLQSVDLTTGDRTLLPSAINGSQTFSNIAYDGANNRAFLSGNSAITVMDLPTGEGAVFSQRY